MYEIYFIYYRKEDGFVQKIEVLKYKTFNDALYYLKSKICSNNDNKFSAYLFCLTQYKVMKEDSNLYILNVMINHSMYNELINYFSNFSDDERLEIISKQQKYWKEVY